MTGDIRWQITATWRLPPTTTSTIQKTKNPRSWNISAQQTGTPGRQQNDPKVGCGTACTYGDQPRFLSSLPLMMTRDHFDLLSMNQTASQVPGGSRCNPRLPLPHPRYCSTG